MSTPSDHKVTPDDQTVWALADVLAYHSRVNPPGGKCSCGHEVPLGARFTEHQVRVVLESEAAQRMLAEARAVGRGEVLLRLDDTDGLANAMNQADGIAQGRISPSWEALSPAGKAFYRTQVETVRAHLLGGHVDPAMVAEFRRLWAEAQTERADS